MATPTLSKPQLSIPWVTPTGSLTPYAASWLLSIFNRSGSDFGTVGGDLTGTYPNPSVIKINGVKLGVTTATNANLLIANGTEWVSSVISGDGAITNAGVLTVTKTNGNGFAASATTDTTNANNISSGTLAVGRGGTGQTSYTNGQLLIGNTAGNTLAKATLSAGSNIAITNGPGSISIGTTGLAASATTDTTNAGNISSGTLAVARGGTGQTSIAGIQAALQTAGFETHVSSTITSVTGDGTQYVVIFDTKDLDTGSNYNNTTGIYTTPQAGLYCFSVGIQFTSLSSSFTNGFIEILVAGADKFIWSGNPFDIMSGSSDTIIVNTRVMHVAASAAIKVNVRITGGTKTVGIGTNSFFSGYLIG